MTDTVDPVTRSWVMRQVKSTGTKPEVAVRRAVHAAGHRYRLHRAELPGKPDLVFPRYRLAVFVHGCFWHWHGCKRSRMPVQNRDYWSQKIDRNVERDRQARESLTALGWTPRIIWECELQDGIERLLAELDTERRVSHDKRRTASLPQTLHPSAE